MANAAKRLFLFDSAKLGFPTPAEAALIKPTEAETARGRRREFPG